MKAGAQNLRPQLTPGSRCPLLQVESPQKEVRVGWALIHVEVATNEEAKQEELRMGTCYRGKQGKLGPRDSADPAMSSPAPQSGNL